MKIRIFNVKYSNNLGDGVIAECLEKEIRNIDANADVKSLDMGGRKSFTDTGVISKNAFIKKFKSVLKFLIGILPRNIRELLISKVSEKIITKELLPIWSSELKQCDAAILGGGQLFSDTGLYFPLRIAMLFKEAAITQTPIFIYSIGIKKKLSKKAKQLFGKYLNPDFIADVTVRDHDSSESWEQHFNVPVNSICRDPGLLAINNYEISVNNNENLVGLGVICQQAIKNNLTNAPDRGVTFYKELIESLNQKGFKVTLFTNGSTEDERLKEQVLSAVNKNAQELASAPTFKEPVELVKFIASMNVVIAHRLHANIIAYSVKTIHFGMEWDPKLEEFLKSVNRSDFFLNAQAKPEDIAEQVYNHRLDHIDEAYHSKVLEETRAGIVQLMNDIEKRASS